MESAAERCLIFVAEWSVAKITHLRSTANSRESRSGRRDAAGKWSVANKFSVANISLLPIRGGSYNVGSISLYTTSAVASLRGRLSK